MKIYFLIISCLLLLLRNGVLPRTLRILGGSKTVISEFPHVVSFRTGDDLMLLCGGTIISQTHILTAAHCLYNVETYSVVKVYVGSTNLMAGDGSLFDIAHVDIHPLFTGMKSEHEMNLFDIAVVVVTDIIEFNQYQNKINLPTSDDYIGNTGFIAGWGIITYPSYNFSHLLMKTSATILTDSQCDYALPFKMDDSQFCAINTIGIGPCYGDSGGGIFIDGKIIGIISASIPCGSGIPDIYTKVYSYLDFINSTML